MGRELDITDFSAVTVDKISVSRWVVDLDRERVTVFVNELDTAGDVYREIEVAFWVTMPQTPEVFDYTNPENPVSFDPPQYEPAPDTWYNLPSGRITEFIAITDEILAAVKGRLYP